MSIPPGSDEERLANLFMAFKKAMDDASSAKDKYAFAKQARDKASELIALNSGNSAHYNKLHKKFVEIIENYEKERDTPPVVLFAPPVVLHGGHPVMLHGGHPVVLHDGRPVVIHGGYPFAVWP